MSNTQGNAHRKEPTLNAKPLLERMNFDNVRDTPYVAPNQPAVRYTPWLLLLLVLLLVLAMYQESRNHFYQSAFWHWYSSKLSYHIETGASDSINYPAAGPFDHRFGYSQLSLWREKLLSAGFEISTQSHFSDSLMRYTNLGFSAPYVEKNAAGLTIQGCNDESLLQSRSPSLQFAQLQQIAPVIIKSLLFVEDRTLLTPEHESANPVINLPRLGAAVLSQIQRAAGIPAAAAGGSTLATQLEKYRHSPQGYTSDIRDKFRQLVSASVRSYQHGVDTSRSRQKIVLDYINTVPLSATASYGEVNGMGEGLYAWFGASPARVNQLLRQNAPYSAEQAIALKQVMALIIAQRRPSYYLIQGRNDLEQLINRYLNLMQQQHIVPPELAQQAISAKLIFAASTTPLSTVSQDYKAVTMVRNRLAQLLDVNLYQLERLDLSSKTTLNIPLQRAISQHLRALNQTEPAEQAGLFGERLLTAGQQSNVKYSFTLYQTTDDGNKVRVQTDNTDQPFDMNDASKLELGSTAKLRVLITYLDIIAELHRLYAEENSDTLQYLNIAPQDNLTNWAVNYLSNNPSARLDVMLQAAIERRYSANPKESFFTGGGLHTFSNFRDEEDKLNPTVAEALQQSINLPFVRLLQDIINYSIYHGENSSYQLLSDDDNPRREQYLRRFADREGSTFVRRFWQKYQAKTAEQRLQLYIGSSRQTPERLAVAYRYIYPLHTAEQFIAFMQQQFSTVQTTQDLEALFNKYQPDAFSLPDRAYLSRSHPLELWLLGYLAANPQANLENALSDSTNTRQQVYQWLFKTRFRSARDNRIFTMLEIEAFWDLHQRWQRLGYPFDYLVPSLASALGSSGDRPAALAELIGIILNNGKKAPTIRIDQLQFADETPYFTEFARQRAPSLQVLDPAVASTVREVLHQVVAKGTARRLNNGFVAMQLTIGGKTGTGDNRLVQLDTKGQHVSSKALNRTATFVFYLGYQHFGVLTAYVPDAGSENFSFTSALPLQVLNSMAPILQPYLSGEKRCN